MTFNKDLDLKISRIVKAPPSAVWEAWTKAEYMEKWFAPEPVVIAIQKHEFYEGGGLAWTMRLEDGTEFSGEHCFLKIVECERLVMTDALKGRLASKRRSAFTAITISGHNGSCENRQIGEAGMYIPAMVGALGLEPRTR